MKENMYKQDNFIVFLRCLLIESDEFVKPKCLMNRKYSKEDNFVNFVT